MNIKKVFPIIFTVIFILIFSLFFGGEYKEFYTQNKTLEISKKELEKKLSNFSLEKTKQLQGVTINYTPNNDILNEIISKINSAQKIIKIEVYIFTEKRIKEAIKKAKKRGVKVQVILEHNPYMAPNINNKTYSFLKNENIEVVWSNTKHYSLNHTKIMIIDNESIISTGNFSYSTFTKNRDFFVFIKDKNITSTLNQIFDNDFIHQKQIVYNDNLLLSPHYSRKKFETLFSSAKKSIKMYFQYFKDEELKNKLIQRKKDGILIQAIIDKKALKSNKDIIKELEDNQIEIKVLKKYNMHSKAILIDSEYLFLGSINFSKYSLDKNKEIGIIMKNKIQIKKFIEIFEKDFKESLQK